MEKTSPSSNERGAVLILAAVALFALVAFSAIVVDYGILWTSRGQAQTAADGGALAGAIAIAKGTTNAVAHDTASVIASQTPVWAQFTAAGDVVVTVPLECPASAGGGDEGCIRVDVMRGAPDASGAMHTNALPVFFASMLGISQQGVRATATAQVTAGNSTKCIKPWGVADKWDDNSGTGLDTSGWDQLDQFDPGVDTYIPSTSTGTTGFTLENDKGLQLALKGDHTNWMAGWSNEIQFPGATGSSDYEAAIVGCPSFIPEVGYYAGQPCDRMEDEDPARGCLRVKTGVSQGPTADGVSTVYDLDQFAVWDEEGNAVVNSAFGDESPRIVPIPLFDPEDFVVNQAASCSGAGCVIKVVNIMGFFLEGVCEDVEARGELEDTTKCADPKKDIVGRIMGHVGTRRGGAGNVPVGNGFILVTRLVR
jgi:Putative Flp pilus-assembly TadE/G-like